MSTNTPAERLAEAVKARREQLHMNQLQVQDAGGPSNTLQTAIENGRLSNLTPRTARKVDAGLMWEKGSAMRIWEGRGEAVSRGVLVDDDGTLHLSDNSEELSALRHYLATVGPDGADAEPPTIALRLWSAEELMKAAIIKHRDETDLLNHFINVLRKRPRALPDAPTTEEVSDPADTDVHLVAAHDEEGSISGEQEQPDTP